METGGRLEFGVCASVDVHYLSTGGARAAAVLAPDAAFAHVLAERTAVLPRVPPYRPGEFYLRELPPVRAVLEHLSGLGLLVVDGYADLDPSGRPGLGARAHAESGFPVIGVAKSRFRTATHAVPVLRGSSVRPISSTIGRNSLGTFSSSSAITATPALLGHRGRSWRQHSAPVSSQPPTARTSPPE